MNDSLQSLGSVKDAPQLSLVNKKLKCQRLGREDRRWDFVLGRASQVERGRRKKKGKGGVSCHEDREVPQRQPR